MSCSGLVILCVNFSLLLRRYQLHCLVSILSLLSFDIVFITFLFYPFATRNSISTEITWKIFLYQVYTNLAYAPPTYRRVKKRIVIMINKNLRKSLASISGNEILIWICNNPSKGGGVWYSKNYTECVFQHSINICTSL